MLVLMYRARYDKKDINIKNNIFLLFFHDFIIMQVE